MNWIIKKNDKWFFFSFFSFYFQFMNESIEEKKQSINIVDHMIALLIPFHSIIINVCFHLVFQDRLSSWREETNKQKNGWIIQQNKRERHTHKLQINSEWKKSPLRRFMLFWRIVFVCLFPPPSIHAIEDILSKKKVYCIFVILHSHIDIQPMTSFIPSLLLSSASGFFIKNKTTNKFCFSSFFLSNKIKHCSSEKKHHHHLYFCSAIYIEREKEIWN